jgi:hypothetical protein
MSKVTFYFPKITAYAVTVDVDDPTDYDQVDEALDKAYGLLPGGGGPYVADSNWSIDLDPTDIEAKYAEDAAGNVVWGTLDE